MNRLVAVNSVVVYTYDPDHRGRISNVYGKGDYVYEPVGTDWISQAGPNYSYHHDDVGNIDVRTGPGVPTGSQTIAYTPFDLPSKITPASGPATDFFYDADGARVIKKTGTDKALFYFGDLYQRTDQSDASKSHRHMIYAGGRAVAQVTVNEHANGSADPPSLRYLYEDILASIQVVTDQNASVVGERDYEPFGYNRRLGSSDSVPYGFTGQEEEPEFGLINMHGRLYDPGLGQFISADPYLQTPAGQGMNRFAYVNNSPLNNTDSTGFSPDLDPRLLVGVGMVGAAWAIGEGLSAGGVAGAATLAAGTAANAAGSVAFNGTSVIAGSIGGGAKAAAGGAAATAAPGVVAGPAAAVASLPKLLNSISASGPKMVGSSPAMPTPHARNVGGDGAVPSMGRGATGVSTAPVQEACVAPLRGYDGARLASDASYDRMMCELFGCDPETGELRPGRKFVIPDLPSGGSSVAPAGQGGPSLWGRLTRWLRGGTTPTEVVQDALAGLRAGRSAGVKVVDSANDLRSLFGRLSAGGKAVQGSRYPGQFVELSDGTTVSLRGASKSGGPTIDIELSSGSAWKVHVALPPGAI